MNRYLIGIVLAIAAASGFWWHGESRYRSGEQAEKQRQHVAELETFRAESKRLAGLSTDLQARIAELEQVRPTIIERYTHETTIAPLPPDCVLDAGRLQHINAAIRAANAANQSGGAVSAGPAADQ